MPFDPVRPYNTLPLLPPRADVESYAVLKSCIAAQAALAETRIAGELIPNQAVLINSIPLFEAQASSEIENIVTTTDRLFRFADQTESQPDPATKETLRYRTALNEAAQTLKRRPLSTATAIEVCRTIRAIETDIRSTPGTALLNEATGAIVHTPPEGSALIRDMLANWEQYIHAEDGVDPLIKMAVMHYQFEAIHPFTDGNGRTGRILNLLYLIECGLIEIPVLYLSRSIIRRKSDYYELLRRVTTEQAWEEWILFMLAAVHETARWTTSKIRAVRKLLDQTAETMRTRVPKIYSHELAEIIFVQPYCRIANLVEAGIAKRQTASEYLKALADIGLLEERSFGREKIFINPAFLRVLSDDTT